MRKLFLLFIVITFIIFFSSCDRTELTGTIIIEGNNFEKGNFYLVKLETPKNLEGIHNILWSVSDENIAIIYDIDNPPKEETLDFKIDNDKIAIIEILNEGQVTIYADGFYKQTNPQPISKKTILIK